MTVTRKVVDVKAYEANANGELVHLGQGVTHYQVPWVPGMAGKTIHEALVAAGLPDTVKVTYLPDEGVLDVALPLDDDDGWADAVALILEET